jgi:hypothetical protein
MKFLHKQIFKPNNYLGHYLMKHYRTIRYLLQNYIFQLPNFQKLKIHLIVSLLHIHQ